MSREIGGCRGKKGYITNESGDPPGSGRMREEGKVDRDKADAIITIFLFYTCRIPSWKLHAGPRRRGAASRHSLNVERLSFTNRAPFPFRSAP